MNNVFKLTVLWSAWTPQVATRIMRDVLTIQRLARSQRATFVVASDADLHPKLEAIGVMASDNMSEPSMTRVYIDQGQSVPIEVADRIPPDVELEVIYLGNDQPSGPDIIKDDTDPYAGVKFYQSWRRIPDTMPLNQKPPPQNDEPMFSPFL